MEPETDARAAVEAMLFAARRAGERRAYWPRQLELAAGHVWKRVHWKTLQDPLPAGGQRLVACSIWSTRWQLSTKSGMGRVACRRLLDARRSGTAGARPQWKL